MRDDPALVGSLLQLADELADIARERTLPFFRRAGLGVESKDGASFDPVTAADRDAEAAMRTRLARDRPDDAVIGEEMGDQAGSSGLTWVIDPLDGTRAFVAGAPTWGTLIAVADDRGPFLGIVDQPYIGERFVGVPGAAWSDGPRGRIALAASRGRSLGDAILMTTFPEIGSYEERRAFAAVSRAVRLTRYGLDCYAYALLAAGHVDLVIEAGLAPHDIAAPIAVIEAAGGIVTSWDGGSAAGGGRVLAAADADLHAAARALLVGAAAG